MNLAPPNLIFTDAAVRAFRDVEGEGGDGNVFRLAIDGGFRNDLFFAPPKPDDVVVTANGVTIAMDPRTARRANGLKIDYVETATEMGFKLDNPNASSPIRGIRPADVRVILEKRERFQFVDVRSATERAAARLDAARLLDDAYEAELRALPKKTKLVFMCHHSDRAHATAQRFYELGFTDVWYIVGGIDAWSTMDPSVPRY